MIKVPLNVASRFWKNDDDISSDDDLPTLKRQKKLRKTSFPDILSTRDMWDDEDRPAKNVRYIPIQVEAGHPSTSTPYEASSRNNRVRTVPIKLVGSSNGRTTPSRKPRLQPVTPIVRTDVDDTEDDDEEVVLVETKPKKHTQYYKAVAQNNKNDDDDDDDDVIFIKEVATPTHHYSGNKKNEQRDDGVKYYKICRNINERGSNHSPREHSKFKGTAGITKAYKKTTPLPKWMQSDTSQSRNRCTTLNGNARSTLSEVFNLDEKRSYQELIKKVADSMKPSSKGKPLDINNLANNSATFRLTQRSQRNALNEIKLVEKGLSADKLNELSKEYDPITIASINSSDSEVEIIPSETSTSSSVKIDRINSLKDSFRDRALTSTDWISKLDSKYKKKLSNTQGKLVDARRESDIISKVNYEQKLVHLEHKLKHELSIPESLIEEPQPTVELPPLTLEQEKLVKKAIGPGPAGQLLVEKFNLRIHRRDLQTLAGLNWLNDEVINFYMNLLMQRSEERKDLPRVYATNTFFYPKLMQSGQAGLKRWTRKVDIFAHDLIVVPVHLGVHWCLSLIKFREKKIHYLDSMGGRNQACLDALLKYLRDEHKDKKGQPFDDSGWSTESLKDIPQQMNGSDCGMFACTFAEFSARNAPYTFTQAHMPYLRRKAALEILQARLLL
ncbi:sentrin-specific protease 2-like isoform X2 [Maniola hyperantus]|uniref:sentrin-specific protease 2-like isoform X2 n=1 Tax=Aphantopus hyperantus TaxID=2795564 RepID=UPI001567E75F|nr:sentrin-specific protease 2-like isoform X2 [Maniola hyperantus]